MLSVMSRFAKYSYKPEEIGNLPIKVTVSAGCFKIRIFLRSISEWMSGENQTDTASLIPTFRDGWGGNEDGDCGRALDKVKACDAALIRKRKLSERREFFLFLIAFSCIAGLLLCLMPCNRNRKHTLPSRPEYVD